MFDKQQQRFPAALGHKPNLTAKHQEEICDPTVFPGIPLTHQNFLTSMFDLTLIMNFLAPPSALFWGRKGHIFLQYFSWECWEWPDQRCEPAINIYKYLALPLSSSCRGNLAVSVDLSQNKA